MWGLRLVSKATFTASHSLSGRVTKVQATFLPGNSRMPQK